MGATSSIILAFQIFWGFRFSIYGTRKIHNDLITRVVRAPINLFFDVTPIGRILNKFSKDLRELEDGMALHAGWILNVTVEITSVIIVSFMVVKWVMLIVPIVFYFAYRTFRRILGSRRELARIHSITRSPMLSFF